MRGLTTGPLRQGGTTFDLTLDLAGHELVARTAAGERRAFALADGLSVAGFDAQLHDALAELGVDVAIQEQPFGAANLGTTPFPDDTEHAAWDRDAIARFHAVLDWSAACSRSSAAGSPASRAPCSSCGRASTCR